MNLGRTRECLKSRKYRRSLNKVKIIPAEHSKFKITCPLKKIKGSLSSGDMFIFHRRSNNVATV